jgi:hypothetical protein
MAPHTSGIGQSDKTGEPGGAVGGVSSLSVVNSCRQGLPVLQAVPGTDHSYAHLVQVLIEVIFNYLRELVRDTCRPRTAPPGSPVLSLPQAVLDHSYAPLSACPRGTLKAL